MSERIDEFGRAFAGSQRHIQTYVNLHPNELNAAIRNALPELANAKIEWVSPLENEHFAEYRDESFIGRIGYPEVVAQLGKFWPSGGPCWDGLAKIYCNDPTSKHGVLLIEAKSYPEEMWAVNGSRAGGAARGQIAATLLDCKRWCDADPKADWMGLYYQYANRLAHVYFFRKLVRVPAWFVNVCFIDDPRTPTTEEKWQTALNGATECLGFNKTPPYSANLILKALEPELFCRNPAISPLPLTTSAIEQQRHTWRFWLDEINGHHQFWAFYNRSGSSSMRIYDARSGLPIGRPRNAKHQNYQSAFRDQQLDVSRPVAGPSTVDLPRIPEEKLRAMQAEVGIASGDAGSPALVAPFSILDGVDEFVDVHLQVTDIGRSGPHYKHLRSYRRVASYESTDGEILIEGMYGRIQENWPGSACPSKQNWRWEKRPEIDDQNDSLEKIFEKAIAREAGDDWVNMVPVASGVMPIANEGGRRIDLVHRLTEGAYEFIELKLGDNCQTPLRAAIEIIEYGLIYLFSRQNLCSLGYDPENPLLNATQINLKVVAPVVRYAPGSLQVFQCAVNKGLAKLIARERLSVHVDFCFEKLPANFTWPFSSIGAVDAINMRRFVYHDGSIDG